MDILTQHDLEMLQVAIREAEEGLAEGGVPVGAALSDGTNLLGRGRNERVQKGDPVTHGETACVRSTGRRKSYAGTTLYTTLSPCLFCQGLIRQFKIPRVVIGDTSTFSAGLDDLRAAGVEVVVANNPHCAELMREFQQKYPEIWAEDIGEL